VNISAKTEYACIAMLELASQYGGHKPVRIRTIAQRHGIPARFLVQILLQLKAAGLVQSTRGAAGGYQLARDPAQVTLRDVMQILDGQPDSITSNAENATAISNTLIDTWNQFLSRQTEMLQAITLAELTQRAQLSNDPMYYI
jgi:Rrf2 family protein